MGKFKIVNWVNFLHFIKNESVFFIKKLLNFNNDTIYTESLFNNNKNDKINNIDMNSFNEKNFELCSIENRISNMNINNNCFKYHYNIL